MAVRVCLGGGQHECSASAQAQSQSLPCLTNQPTNPPPTPPHPPNAGVKADVERSCLILETGVSQRWRYGAWRPSPDSIAEAQGWEESKAGLAGLHFLAVQPDPDSEELKGLWLLLDKLPPNV